MQVFNEEHAALLGLAVVAERLVALFGKAAGIGACIVVTFGFTVGEEATVLLALCAPAHAGTAVEHANATARDHDIELALRHVATDIRCHDDELFALDGFGVCICRVVVPFAREGQLVALAAGAAVTCRHCGEGEAHVGATVNGERNLACAGHHRAAGADAPCAPVGAFGGTLVGALLGVVRGVVLHGTMGLAAVPVTGCPAGTSLAAVLDNDVRASASQLCRRTGLYAGAGLSAGTGFCAAG